MKLFNRFFFSSQLLFAASVLILSGCAITPTTVGFDGDENDYFSTVLPRSASSSFMRVSAVEPTNTVNVETIKSEVVKVEEDAQEEPVIVYRNTYSSTKGYWKAAIKYLQTGDAEGARWALEKALMLNSRSRVANVLIRQLDVDVEVALGSSYFEYRVKYGDTLSKLSKAYLDDSLKFYLLARYNNIENPSRLKEGQIIRIPGNKNPLKIAPVSNKLVAEKNKNIFSVDVAKTNGPAGLVTEKSRASSLLEDAREMLMAGETSSTITLIENNVVDIDSDLDVKKILVKAYYLEAKKLLKSEDFSQSTLLLNRAVELEPENAEVNMMLIDMSEFNHADDIYDDSIEALEKNDIVAAYSLINKALKVQPDSRKIIVKKQEIAKLLSTYYYKQALMAQRKHELDSAIEYWDEVLALDKSNDNAKLYRAKAINLKIRLEKFVSSQ